MSMDEVSKNLENILTDARTKPWNAMPLPWETNHWLSMVLDEPKSILDFPVIREPPEHLTWPQR
eukprot:2087496-Amphidinium_carterae.1